MEGDSPGQEGRLGEASLRSPPGECEVYAQQSGRSHRALPVKLLAIIVKAIIVNSYHCHIPSKSGSFCLVGLGFVGSVCF